ncbi:MAG: histidine phosphatase family protein [bacterium]
MQRHKVRFLVVRHAESLEDVDKTAYERVADRHMPLSDRGRLQALKMGSGIKKDGLRHLRFILSPGRRVFETAEIMASELPFDIKSSFAVEPLIEKQNWGDTTIFNREVIERERRSIGILRYCFPGGESGAELLFRFAVFVKKLELDLLFSSSDELIVVITHGLEMGILLKILLGWTEEQFEAIPHPKNGYTKEVSFDRRSKKFTEACCEKRKKRLA